MYGGLLEKRERLLHDRQVTRNGGCAGPGNRIKQLCPIVEETADDIVLAVESLRSRSISSRYMSITGRFRAEIEKIGGSIEGIGAHRAISVRLPDDRKIWAYPVVGVPTAELLNDVADKARRADQQETPVLVYDHVGIRDQWTAHLKWLDENIRAVRAVRVLEAGWILAGWEA